MRLLIRSCAVYASLLVLAALLIGGVYYFSYRPLLPDNKQLTEIEQLIKDPHTSIEQLREVALESHKVVVTNFKILDAAVQVTMLLGVVAATGFMFIRAGMRKSG